MKVILNLVFFFLFISTISCLNKQKDCQCRILPELKIVGGKKAHHLAYPWIVSLSQKRDNTPYFFKRGVKEEKKIDFHSCGGTIINEYWILTAAHCIENEIFGRLYAGYGNDNDLAKIFDFGRIESRTLIKNPAFHQDEKTQSIYNDIALVKLKEPIQFTENVKPACFLNENQDLYTGYLDHAGWGSTEVFKVNTETMEFSKPKASKNLKEMFLTDQSDSYINCKYDKNVICAKGLQKGESSCKGDSGGPVHYTKNGKSYVVGLTSYSAEQHWENKIVNVCVGTTVYTRVPSYISWLKKYVKDDICEF